MVRYAVLLLTFLVIVYTSLIGLSSTYVFTYRQSTYIYSKVTIGLTPSSPFNFSVANKTNGIWVCLPRGFYIENISLSNFTLVLGDQAVYVFPYYDFYVNSTYYGYIVSNSSTFGKILIKVVQLNETPPFEKETLSIFSSSTETSHPVNYSYIYLVIGAIAFSVLLAVFKRYK